MKNILFSLALTLTPFVAEAETNNWPEFYYKQHNVDSIFELTGATIPLPASGIVVSGGNQVVVGESTAGWEFNVINQPITLIKLGVYDDTPESDLFQNHEIGIWDSTGALLASASIPLNVPLGADGNFKYISITPITLSVANDYRIGATYNENSPQLDTLLVNVETLITHPNINFVQNRVRSGPSLSRPDFISSPQTGFFGPNFIVDKIFINSFDD